MPKAKLIDIRTQVDKPTHEKILKRQAEEQIKGKRLTIPEVAALLLKEDTLDNDKKNEIFKAIDSIKQMGHIRFAKEKILNILGR